MVREIQGDLISLFKQGVINTLIHGCNCQKVLSSGLSYEIAKEFPDAKEVDDTFSVVGVNRLGNYSYVTETSSEYNRTICNFYTQYQPGPNFNILAFEVCLIKFAIHYRSCRQDLKIGIPALIGYNTESLDLGEVKALIDKYLSEFDVTIVNYVANF